MGAWRKQYQGRTVRGRIGRYVGRSLRRRSLTISAPTRPPATATKVVGICGGKGCTLPRSPSGASRTGVGDASDVLVGDADEQCRAVVTDSEGGAVAVTSLIGAWHTGSGLAESCQRHQALAYVAEKGDWTGVGRTTPSSFGDPTASVAAWAPVRDALFPARSEPLELAFLGRPERFRPLAPGRVLPVTAAVCRTRWKSEVSNRSAPMRAWGPGLDSPAATAVGEHWRCGLARHASGHVPSRLSVPDRQQFHH